MGERERERGNSFIFFPVNFFFFAVAFFSCFSLCANLFSSRFFFQKGFIVSPLSLFAWVYCCCFFFHKVWGGEKKREMKSTGKNKNEKFKQISSHTRAFWVSSVFSLSLSSSLGILHLLRCAPSDSSCGCCGGGGSRGDGGGRRSWQSSCSCCSCCWRGAAAPPAAAVVVVADRGAASHSADYRRRSRTASSSSSGPPRRRRSVQPEPEDARHVPVFLFLCSVKKKK